MKRILSFFLLSLALINALAQIPAGYYNNATGLSSAALKTALSQIITNGHSLNITYNDLWSAYQTTDRDYDYDNDGTILDIYSEFPVGPDNYNYPYGTSQCSGTSGPEGHCYNREHIIPQSFFNQGLPMRSDAHFVRATDGKVNGERGDLPFGKVATANYTSQNGSKRGLSASAGYSNTVFEPIDEFKGDVARMIFYFVTRYENKMVEFSTGDMLAKNTYPSLQDWELTQLMAWHIQDPVSAAEIRRNNATYTFQGNRNPFIDHPEYVMQIWGAQTPDTENPTAATNLATSNPTSNSIDLTWTAATDNVGVVSYSVYVNGILKTTVPGTSTSTTVTGLSPLTTYNFYLIAKDAFGNSSPQSNIASGVTLDGPVGTGGCGTENFNTITDNDSSYSERIWTNNGITWKATNTKVDQPIGTTKAITIRTGELTSSSIAGGIKSLTLTTKRIFSGSNGSLNVLINGTNVGTIPYTTTATTTTIDNINISGDIIIKITSTTGNRPTMDDLSWTCYNESLSTSEVKKDKSQFTIYPNPVKNNELFVKGENLNKISKAEIYDLSGKTIEVIANPFKNSNKINLKGLVKGTYILKTDNFSTKFIVE